MTDQDPCVPGSKLSYTARAVLYDKWNYDCPHGYSESARSAAGLDYDPLLRTEADKLYAAWDRELGEGRRREAERPMRRVSVVYDTPEGEAAVAAYQDEDQ